MEKELSPQQLRELADAKEKEAKRQSIVKRHARGVRAKGFMIHNMNRPFKIGNDDAYIEFDGENKTIKIKGRIIYVHDEIASEEQPAPEVSEQD